jgi:hypothetical protein
MNEIPNGFMLIGLHKLAAGRGDGLIPELLALYSGRGASAGDEAAEVDCPGRAQHETSMKSAGNDNIIPLRPYLPVRERR